MLARLVLVTNLAGAHCGTIPLSCGTSDPTVSSAHAGSRSDEESEPHWLRYPKEIPAPAAVWLGLGGLFGLAGFGVARRRCWRRARDPSRKRPPCYSAAP